MASAEILALLLRLAAAATVALFVVLALRGLARAVFGANAAYAAWALVPIAMLAATFGREAPAGGSAPVVTLLDATPRAAPAAAASTVDHSLLLVLAWTLGAVLWFAWRVASQRRWRRSMGVLRCAGDGLAYAARDSAVQASLPAATGWPRAIIVLPADFETRFASEERQLVVDHERRHVDRGDLHAQMLAELIRRLLWFHPLAHWATARFRHDQELACDADVLRGRPQQVAAYARALAAASGLRLPPVATAWGFSHPLTERLAMLQKPHPSAARRRVGLAVVALLIGVASSLAWAALTRAPDVPPGGMLRQSWTLKIDDGKTLGPFLLVDAPGAPAAIEFFEAGSRWRLESTAVRLAEGQFRISARIARDGALLHSPELVLDGKGAIFAMGEALSVSGEGIEGFKTPRGLVAEIKVESDDGLPVMAKVPAYPEALAEAGVEGTVVLRVAVDASGKPTAVRVETSSGHVELDQLAEESARTWQFSPAKRGGVAVADELLVPVAFRADGHAPAARR